MTSVSGDSTTSDNAQAALLRRRAIHVAGHAVIALVWDFKVLYLTIRDTCRTAPPHIAADWVDARVLVARPENLYGRSRQAELFVRIVLASSVAQQLYADDDACSSNWRVCGHDYELAWSAAANFESTSQDPRPALRSHAPAEAAASVASITTSRITQADQTRMEKAFAGLITVSC